MNRTVVLALAALLALAACGGGAPATGGPGAATAPIVTQAASGAATTSPSVSPTVAETAVPTATAGAAAQPDYTGEWGGERVAGTLKYCGSTAHPYWAADLVDAAGERAFMSYLIPPGSTAAIEGTMDVPFIVDEYNAIAAGTGQFVPGNPPHFIVVNTEGGHDITLKVGKFCSSTP